LISNPLEVFSSLEVSSSLESELSEEESEEERTDFKNRYSGNNVDVPECEILEVARQTWLGMCFSWMKVFTSMVCDWVRGRRVRW
jgi:hypothetical protein